MCKKDVCTHPEKFVQNLVQQDFSQWSREVSGEKGGKEGNMEDLVQQDFSQWSREVSRGEGEKEGREGGQYEGPRAAGL